MYRKEIGCIAVKPAFMVRIPTPFGKRVGEFAGAGT
jgi:hypothetical protein